MGRLERRVDRLERSSQRARRTTARARRAEATWSRRGRSRSRIGARVREREHAESVLSSQITLMLAMARQRASMRAASGTRAGFKRPVRGHISQRYGCRARRKGRDGRCVRFHDGVDIAARRGSLVRASASGYVAYAGFSPWDRGRRAWIVIIGHARGYESVYAHLRPQRRVRAGQRVRRGQVIGAVGLTGRTSGAHVHWEISKGFRTRNPLRAEV